ncbi:MAG: type I asparaginase [Bacteroidetes bacterium]|nr:type I asparaginase [Bacteroidota bacterium]
MPEARVFILYTGGTIGMGHLDPAIPHSPLVPKSWEELQHFMPSIQPNGYFPLTKGIEFEYHSFDEVMDSSQFNTGHWKMMAEEIEKRYDDFDGFIIIHGTDTMAYTASGLSFMFENLAKPVVLTGSQLPISHSRTDAVNNLSNAIHVAAAKAFDLDLIPEVCVCFNDKLLRGNRSTKASTNDFDGFISPNYQPLAELEEKIKIRKEYVLNQPTGNFLTQTELNINVIEIGLFPGMRPDLLRKLVIDDEVDGLILKTYGSGNAPCSDEFVSVLRKAHDNGTHIMFISQCLQGGVEMGKYNASSPFQNLGIISGGDMTPEAALAKMMFVLGLRKSYSETRFMLQQNLVGERSI